MSTQTAMCEVYSTQNITEPELSVPSQLGE